MNVRALLPLVLPIVLGACDVPEVGILIRSVVENAGESQGGQIKCEFESDGEPAPFLRMDSAYTMQHTYPMAVLNSLSGQSTNFGTEDAPVELRDPNEVSPLRMDIRWECDSNGFSADLGPIVIPAFDPTLPFCLEKRAEANESFKGFDVVAVKGSTIEAGGGEGLVYASVVPFAMGRAIDETWDVATFADSCCRDSTNCNGQNPTAPGCQKLEQVFRTLDPLGANLQVASPSPTEPSEDLLRFRPFSIFDGDYHMSVDPKAGDSLFGAYYVMRFRGVVEFVNTAGDLVVSNEYVDHVGFCRHCGLTQSASTRGAYTDNHNVCYAF